LLIGSVYFFYGIPIWCFVAVGVGDRKGFQPVKNFYLTDPQRFCLAGLSGLGLTQSNLRKKIEWLNKTETA